MAPTFQGLVDQYGRPIEKAALKVEQAPPTSSFFRNPYAPNPAAGLTPDRLANILRTSIDGYPELYLALAEDMEERYPQYASTLSTRKRAVMGLEISVDPASDDPQDKREADLVRQVVESAAFRGARMDMLDALGKGFSASELIWDTAVSAWLPKAIKYRDPRFFEFDRIDPERILLIDQAGRLDLKPWGWIVHRAKAKSGLTVRGGIARQVAWLYLFQAFTAKDWAIFCEAYGQPIRVGKYGPDASPDDKAALMEAVRNIAVDFAGIIPSSMEVDITAASISGNTELFNTRLSYLDQQCSKIVVGQTGTTDVIKGGGYAASKVHDLVREDIVDSDAEQLADTLNDQLVQPLVLLNFAQRARKGFPKIKIGRPEEEDVAALVDNVVKLIPFGLPVTIAEMQAKVGVRPPVDGEALLTAPASPAPALPMDPAANDDTQQGEDANAASVAGRTKGDAIDSAVRAMLAGSGWEPLVSPVVDGLADELAVATTIDEAKAILKRRAESMGVTAFVDMLARSAFQGQLAGETDESLT
jgi:phage gp29-like protein